MPKIGKTFTFEAAHRLQNHDGKCRRLHGHSYRVEVELRHEHLAEAGPQQGMVLDFGELKNMWWEPIEASYDHRTILESGDPLENVLPAGDLIILPEGTPPTAENLAQGFVNGLRSRLPGFSRYRVRVYETATSYAEASARA